MWRRPPLTKASYVGRLAPPGRPNTTSTPSAFRHSISASTARIRPSFRESGSEAGARRDSGGPRPNGRRSLPDPSRASGRARGGAPGARHAAHVLLRGDRLDGEVELLPTDDADRVVELRHAAASRALPAQLTALVAVEHRACQPDER